MDVAQAAGMTRVLAAVVVVVAATVHLIVVQSAAQIAARIAAQTAAQVVAATDLVDMIRSRIKWQMNKGLERAKSCFHSVLIIFQVIYILINMFPRLTLTLREINESPNHDYGHQFLLSLNLLITCMYLQTIA